MGEDENRELIMSSKPIVSEIHHSENPEALANTPKRKRNVLSTGEEFSKEYINYVWNKARASMENHPLVHSICKTFLKGIKDGTYVLDDYGHLICRDEFGQKSKHGWEIDHIHPVEKKNLYTASSSIDDVENLRALHWQSNERKSSNDARIYELEYEHVILNKAS